MKKQYIAIFIILLLFTGCSKIGYKENIVYSEKSLASYQDNDKEKAASKENAIAFSKYNFEKIFGINIDSSNMFENVISMEDPTNKSTLWKIVWESDQSQNKFYSTVDSKNNEILSMGFYYTSPPSPITNYTYEKVGFAQKMAGLFMIEKLNLNLSDYINYSKALYSKEDGMFYIKFISIKNDGKVITLIVNPNTDEVVGFSKE